jgi:hypothetical protein
MPRIILWDEWHLPAYEVGAGPQTPARTAEPGKTAQERQMAPLAKARPASGFRGN